MSLHKCITAKSLGYHHKVMSEFDARTVKYLANNLIYDFKNALILL